MSEPHEDVSPADFSQKSVWRKLTDFLFGYDYFISYAWADGRNYAAKLAEALEELGLECFLDSDDYAKGDNWKSVGQRALAKTSRLVLIGSPKALEPTVIFRILALDGGGIKGKFVAAAAMSGTSVMGDLQRKFECG